MFSSVKTKEGEGVVLECVANGVPPPRLAIFFLEKI